MFVKDGIVTARMDYPSTSLFKGNPRAKKNFISGEKNEEECRQRELVWSFQDTVEVGHNPRGAANDFMDLGH
jgi:hypothetical protein